MILKFLPKNHFLLLNLFFWLFSCSNTPERENNVNITHTALIGLTIIDGLGNPPQENMVIILKDSLIENIIPLKDYEPRDFIQEWDLKGKVAIPGLIDMHAHATVLPLDSNGRLQQTYDKEISLESLQTMLAFGITTIRNPAAPTLDGIELKELVKNDSILSPTIFTSGAALNRIMVYFGPFVATPTEEDIRKEIQRQVAAGVDFIKVYSSLKPHLIKVAIEEAHQQGVKVAGHLQNTSWTEAANMGIDWICHAAPWHFAYMPEAMQVNYKPTFKGRIEWLENVDYEGKAIQEMLEALKENKISIDPNLIVFHTKFWAKDSMHIHNPDLKYVHPNILGIWNVASFVGDWTATDFERAQKQWNKLAMLTKLMYDKGILLTVGTDFPNPWVIPGVSVHQEMELLEQAGIPVLDVLKMATHNAACTLGIDKNTGSIEKGKVADMLILNTNPLENIQNTRDILHIIQAGKIYNPKDLLP